MDALEPAEGMLELARKKKVYKNIFHQGLSTDPLPIESSKSLQPLSMFKRKHISLFSVSLNEI